ncbi:MAG: phosphoribosylformylglycinamidine cyclo-ligase [Acidobacteria bacterium]|nr:phosphoribosylformylglycinamidine cyclo-ligase [Acidobacteriota bacterium]
MTKTITYADAGVDISRADQTKKRIAALAKKTFTRAVLGGIGGFGALYALEKKRWKSPVLVSSTDSVGTKLKIAFATGRHRSVAADLVNHCANDIAVQGAQPLFFLDYIGSGRLDPAVIEKVVAGLSDACRAHGCALIGGETAELPGFYAEGEYDLAGFIVGIVERSKILTGSRICPGDILLGLPSVGLHTNGYSLARKLLLETAGYSLDEHVPRLGCTVAEELLKPHRSYAKTIARLNEAGLLRGAAHITGGGIPGNLPRIFPKGVEARINPGSWPVLPVFELLREIGSVPNHEMWRSFNMGIGMILIISPRDLPKATALLKKSKEQFFETGAIAKGKGRVVLQSEPRQ